MFSYGLDSTRKCNDEISRLVDEGVVSQAQVDSRIEASLSADAEKLVVVAIKVLGEIAMGGK